MKKIQPEKIGAFLAIILSAVFLRLMPHIPNVAPIGALALFSGMTIPNVWGIALPLVAMVVSDFFLGFHATIPYVYGSFILIGLIGYSLRGKKGPFQVGLGSILGSVIFFIMTNFGVWVISDRYQKSVAGLLDAYIWGLPFFRNTLIGDLFFNALFLAGFWAFSKISKQIANYIRDLVHYHFS